MPGFTLYDGRMMKVTLNTVTKSLLALGCAAIISSTVYAEPANLSLLKQEIETYHDSGLYEKELAKAISQAQDYIIKEAKLNARQGNKKKLAIVLDIDETSLSNYQNMVKRHFSADLLQIHKEILAANAPAIAPMLLLYDNAQKHGVDIFFVTGRKISELSATRTNLLRAGFTNWKGLFLRPDDYNKASIVPFKTKARETISKQGYTIIASIGDQYSDIQGGFAQKGFKLPNPYYYLP